MANAAIPGRVKLLIYSLSVNNLSIGYFLVYITSYLAQVSLAASTIGFLVAVEGGVAVTAGVPLGLMSDRRGRKWILILGSAAVGPALLIFVIASTLPLFLLAVVLLGLAESAALSSWNAIIADQTEVANRTRAFSLSFVLSNVLTAAGFALPLAFPIIEGATGLSSEGIHRLTLGILGVANVSTPLVLVRLLRGYRERIRLKENQKRNWGVIAKFTSVNALIGFGAGLIIPLVPTWLLLRFGVPDTFSGPLLAISNITIGFSAIASPRVARRFGVVGAFVLTTASSTVFFFSLGLVSNVVVAGFVYVVRSALMNMSSPLLDSFAMSIVLPEERGFLSAVNSVIWRMPNTVSTVIGGILLQSGSYSLPFFLASGLYAAGITSFYLVFRKTKPIS